MALSQTLWQAHQAVALACLHHPFVTGIGDGSLEAAKFAYYIAQDRFFLESFARAYSIAAAKAPSWSAFQLFHQMADGVLEELRLHGAYAQSWGVDLDTVKPGSATRQYTDFLLHTAWSQDAPTIAVAMAPCMRLYAFLGQSLVNPAQPPHPYSAWVETYSSDQFEPLVQQLEDFIDDWATDTALVRQTYDYAMACELNFFQAAWQAIPQPHTQG
ncbi:MAG: TenA family protein [Cyanobacteria bacterium REEB459]|nr:TenA family protein [Cyanobacteria bacterium REEB459]